MMMMMMMMMIEVLLLLLLLWAGVFRKRRKTNKDFWTRIQVLVRDGLSRAR